MSAPEYSADIGPGSYATPDQQFLMRNSTGIVSPCDEHAAPNASAEIPGTEGEREAASSWAAERVEPETTAALGLSALTLEKSAKDAGKKSLEAPLTHVKAEGMSRRQVKDGTRVIPHIVSKHSSHEVVHQLIEKELQARPVTDGQPGPLITDELLNRLDTTLATVRSVRGSLIALHKGIEAIEDVSDRTRIEHAFFEMTASFMLLFGRYRPWITGEARAFAQRHSLPRTAVCNEALGTLATSIGGHPIVKPADSFSSYLQKRLGKSFMAFKKTRILTEYRILEQLIDFRLDTPTDQRHLPLPDSQTTISSSSPSQAPELSTTRKDDATNHPSAPKIPTESEAAEPTELLPLNKRINMALSENRTRSKPRSRRSGHHGRRSTNM